MNPFRWVSLGLVGILLLWPRGAAAVPGPADPIEVAASIAAMSGLEALPCDLDFVEEIPLFFRFHQRDGSRVATFAALVPTPVEEIARILETPERYPDWFLLRGDGGRNLHAFELDDDGRGYLQIAASDGLRLDAELKRIDDEAIRGVSVELDAGWGVLTGTLVLAARQSASCGPGTSLLTGSLSWRMGWLGRLLPRSIKNLPGALALSIRDGLLAQVLSSDRAFVEELMAEPVHGRQDLSLQTLRPLVLSGEAGPLQSEQLRDFLIAVSGQREVTRWRATFRSPSGDLSSYTLGSEAPGYLYGIELVLKRRGYALSKTWQSSIAGVRGVIVEPGEAETHP